MTTSVVVGGSGFLGRTIAEHFAQRGDTVLITGRDKANAESVAATIGPDVHGLAIDLSEPDAIETAFSRSSRCWFASGTPGPPPSHRAATCATSCKPGESQRE